MLVPDNCETTVIHTRNWCFQQINESYHELAEHYNTGILPARVRNTKDNPATEENVGQVSTWIIAALRNEQFYFLSKLNNAIVEQLKHTITGAEESSQSL